MGRYRLLIAFLSTLSLLAGYPCYNEPVMLQDPDGAKISALITGDEFYRYVHDSRGFTIVRSHHDGYHYYATCPGRDIVPTAHRAAAGQPESFGLHPHALLPVDAYLARRKEAIALSSRDCSRTPDMGSVENIVVFVRFSDQSEFDDPRTAYLPIFNNMDHHSLYSYYAEVSYGRLAIHSHFFPVCDPFTSISFQDTHPRAYYQPFDTEANPLGYRSISQGYQRMQQLTFDAVTTIAPEVPAGLEVDSDYDGYIDSITLIVRGNAGLWADVLWSQHAYFAGVEARINGAWVRDINFHPENQVTLPILAHEMFHGIGAPDLYRYSASGFNPVGPWDVMAGGNGNHMCSYLKWRYGNWIDDIPTIAASGTYFLHPLTESTNNCYRINTDVTDNEYFVVEFRKGGRGDHDNGVPGSGLLVWRVNEASDGDGNGHGPPDELIVYHPGGTNSINDLLDCAHFSAEVGRTDFSDESEPADFLSDDSLGHIKLHQIGSALGDSISFILNPGYGVLRVHVTSSHEQTDLEDAEIRIAGSVYHPLPNGILAMLINEGHYSLSVHLENHADISEQIFIETGETTGLSVPLVWLPFPTNLTGQVCEDRIELRWDEPPATLDGFIGYNVYRKINDLSWTQVAQTILNHVSLPLPNHHLRFAYFISACYTIGISDSSNVVTIEATGDTETGSPQMTSDRLISITPNPFNPAAILEFELQQPAMVNLDVYNVRGQRVSRISLGRMSSGKHRYSWLAESANGQNLPSGVYVINLLYNGRSIGKRKSLLIK